MGELDVKVVRKNMRITHHLCDTRNSIFIVKDYIYVTMSYCLIADIV